MKHWIELVLASLEGKELEDSHVLKLGVVDEGRVVEFAGGLVLDGPPLEGGSRV